MTAYLLDTNALSDLIASQPKIIRQTAEHLANGDLLGLCRPVHYEILRGLFWRGATAKLRIYRQRIIPLLNWTETVDLDWEEAARLWAQTRSSGKQLSDPDLFLAAIASRTGAILVSTDADFDALLLQREDWRK